MRIYFIGQKGIPAKFGGIERHVEELSKNLAKSGHDIFVYTRLNYTPSNLNKYQGVNLISLPSIPTKYLDTITHTLRACFDVIRKDVDIIHFHSIGPSSLLLLVKLFKPRTPIVATFHTKCYMHAKWGFFSKIYLKFGEWMACRFANKTITVSNSLTKYAGEKYRMNPCYIPNGVSISDGIEGEIHWQKPSLQESWGLQKGGYIIAVSRLIGHKGLHYLIDAYKKIQTDKKLVIVGDGVHTDKYVKKLHDMAKNNQNIIFTGNQTGNMLRALYENAYLFIQPSESEGLSIALLEAMSYGKSVLVSDIPENKEAIGDNGRTFRSANSEDLSSKLNYLLTQPSIVHKDGELNKERVKKLYNWDKISKKTIEIYEECINNSKLKVQNSKCNVKLRIHPAKRDT
ncbi:MAG: glycosyltransferase family 4 protein [bacterium]